MQFQKKNFFLGESNLRVLILDLLKILKSQRTLTVNKLYQGSEIVTLLTPNLSIY